MNGEFNYDMTITCVDCKKDMNPKHFNFRIISEKVRAWSDTCEFCLNKNKNQNRKKTKFFADLDKE
jgi:hypothetical protein